MPLNLAAPPAVSWPTRKQGARAWATVPALPGPPSRPRDKRRGRVPGSSLASPPRAVLASPACLAAALPAQLCLQSEKVTSHSVNTTVLLITLTIGVSHVHGPRFRPAGR